MRLPADRIGDIRVEMVTAAFVASGTPDGIHDMGRFLENLNNPTVAQQVELRDPAVRPLYQATLHVDLDAPLLVRRDELIFATFEGPDFRQEASTRTAEVPVLLMAPPFQISGTVEIPADADPTQALRAAMPPFFAVKSARVFDTDGVPLGEGDVIVVNSAAVQMRSATRKYIEAAAPAPAKRRELEIVPAATPRKATRAA